MARMTPNVQVALFIMSDFDHTEELLKNCLFRTSHAGQRSHDSQPAGQFWDTDVLLSSLSQCLAQYFALTCFRSLLPLLYSAQTLSSRLTREVFSIKLAKRVFLPALNHPHSLSLTNLVLGCYLGRLPAFINCRQSTVLMHKWIRKDRAYSFASESSLGNNFYL